MARQVKANIPQLVKDELEYLRHNGCDGVSLGGLGRQAVDGLLAKEKTLGQVFKSAGCTTEDEKREYILKEIVANQKSILTVKINKKDTFPYGTVMGEAELREALSRDTTITLSEDLANMDKNAEFRAKYPVRHEYALDKFREIAASASLPANTAADAGKQDDAGKEDGKNAQTEAGAEDPDKKDDAGDTKSESEQSGGGQQDASEADTKADGQTDAPDTDTKPDGQKDAAETDTKSETKPAEGEKDDGAGKPETDTKPADGEKDEDPGKPGPATGGTKQGTDTAPAAGASADTNAAAAAEADEKRRQEAAAREKAEKEKAAAQQSAQTKAQTSDSEDDEDEDEQEQAPEADGGDETDEEKKPKDAEGEGAEKDGEEGEDGKSAKKGGQSGNGGKIDGSAEERRAAVQSKLSYLDELLERKLISPDDHKKACATVLVNGLILETNQSIKALSDISNYMSKSKDGTIKTWWTGRDFQRERKRHAKISAEAVRSFNEMEEMLQGLTNGNGQPGQYGQHGHSGSGSGGIFSGIKSRMGFGKGGHGGSSGPAPGGDGAEQDGGSRGDGRHRGAGGTIRKAAGKAVVVGAAVGHGIFKNIHPIMWVKNTYNDIRDELGSARADNKKPENAKDKATVKQMHAGMISDPESETMCEGAKNFAKCNAAMSFECNQELQMKMMETMASMQASMAKQSELMEKMSERLSQPVVVSTEDVINAVQKQAADRQKAAAEDAARMQKISKEGGSESRQQETGGSKEHGAGHTAEGSRTPAESRSADTNAPTNGSRSAEEGKSTEASKPATPTEENKGAEASKPAEENKGSEATVPTDGAGTGEKKPGSADVTEDTLEEQARKNADAKAGQKVDTSNLTQLQQVVADMNAQEDPSKTTDDDKTVGG